MTHGYLGVFGDGEYRDYRGMAASGVTNLEAVATDWLFGTTPVVPPTGGGWYETRRRRPFWLEDEEWLILGVQ